VYEQPLGFSFDPTVHAYIYPARQPGGEAALVRYAVSPDLVIFQDTGERHVFYYLPDEFRLTRDDVPLPHLQTVAADRLSRHDEHRPRCHRC
jgi:hypothetical protein